MEALPPPRVDQLITVIFEIILYCIHLSVIIVMIFRRKTVFNSAFYYILLTICIADFLFFCLVSRSGINYGTWKVFMANLNRKVQFENFFKADKHTNFQSLFAVRLVNFGIFTNFFLNNAWLASALFTLSNVFAYQQFIGQTLISINRFTVFWLPARHRRIWKGKWYLFILIGLPLLVIPTRIPDGGKVVISKSGVLGSYASDAMEDRALYMTSAVYIVNGTLTVIFSTLAVLKYSRLRISGNVMPVPQLEARILAFSIIIFCIQMLRVVYVFLRNLFLPFPGILAVLVYLLPFLSDFHAWVCSISVIFMSQASRKAYFEFYFGTRKPNILFLSNSTTTPA